MTKTFLKYVFSTVLGVGIAFSILGAMQFIAPNFALAQGNSLSSDYLLDDSFTGATGLGDTDIKTTLGNIINVILGFLGIVAVGLVLWGGFKWMTAGGNDTKVGEAKKILISGVIGLAIIFSAFAITNFVLTSIIESSGGGGATSSDV